MTTRRRIGEISSDHKLDLEGLIQGRGILLVEMLNKKLRVTVAVQLGQCQISRTGPVEYLGRPLV